MATDAVAATFDGGVPNFTGDTGKDAAECHEKNLDIGSGHNTQTAMSSMRESNDPKKKIKNM